MKRKQAYHVRNEILVNSKRVHHVRDEIGLFSGIVSIKFGKNG